MLVLEFLVAAPDVRCSEVRVLGCPDVGGGTGVTNSNVNPHALAIRGPVRDQLVQDQAIALAVAW